MFNKRFRSLVSRVGKSRFGTPLFFMAVFLLLISPTLYLTRASYINQRDHFINGLYQERSTLVQLGTERLRERFEGLKDLGTSLATRDRMRELIETGDWEGAIGILEDIPPLYSDVERVFLADPDGVLRADTPAQPGNVRGTSFAFRDWYLGVSRNWEPYVSEVFRRQAIPQYNVVNIAVPIRTDVGDVLGILALQVRLESLEQWATKLQVGQGGFIYFVDQYGHPIAHPDYPSTDEIPNLATLPDLTTAYLVRKVLDGNTGIEVADHPSGDSLLAAYGHVKSVNWGVVVQENTKTAFAPLYFLLQRELIGAFVIVLLSVFISLILILLIRYIYNSLQTEQAMLKGIGDGVIAIDRNFNILLWNRMAGKITGFSEEEAVGKPLRSIVRFVREKDGKENLTFLEETMLFGTVHQMENSTFLVAKDGRRIPVADSAAPIFNRSGGVVGVIVVFRDVESERAIDRAKDEFISLASHQLRSPITGISWGLQTLAKGVDKMTPKQKDLITELRNQIDHLHYLVEALLNTSRVDMGVYSIDPSPIDLKEIAQSVITSLMPQIRQKKTELKTTFDPKLPLINADPKLVTIIFQNLLSNAIKYTPEGGKVELQVKKSEAYAEITLRDTGVGISDEEKGRIFTKMFRTIQAKTIDPNGNGLGLYLVKSILDTVGGSVRFDSRLNKGTTFYVKIPLSGMDPRRGERELREVA